MPKHFNRDSGKEERRMNQHRRRTVPPGSLVHIAAFERGKEYCTRLPPDVEWVGKATSPAASDQPALQPA